MADLPAHAHAGGDTGVGPDPGSPTGTPRWVKVFGTFAIVLILLVGVVLLAGGGPGGHGPGRHTGFGDPGGKTRPSSAPEGHRPPSSAREGHTPPPGVPHDGAQRP